MLTSCGLMSDSNAVTDPTVEQMANLEREWGLKPRETRPRYSPYEDPSTHAPAPSQFPAPAPQPPALNPLPYPSTPATPTQTIPLPPSEAPSIPSSLR